MKRPLATPAAALLAALALSGCTTAQMGDAAANMLGNAFMSAIGLEEDDPFQDGPDGGPSKYAGRDCAALAQDYAAANSELAAWRLREARAAGPGGSQAFASGDIHAGLTEAHGRRTDIQYAQRRAGC